MLLRNSSGESSPARMLQKLPGSTQLCCEVLPLWQAGKLALMEAQEVPESISQQLADRLPVCVQHQCRSSVVTEAAPCTESQVLLLVGINTETRVHGSAILETSKFHFLYHVIVQ